MAKVPSPEETAREILDIFVSRFKLRAGKALRIRDFNAVWHTLELHADDFKPGMEHAAVQGWVEVLPGGELFKLTDAGFTAAATKNDMAPSGASQTSKPVAKTSQASVFKFEPTWHGIGINLPELWRRAKEKCWPGDAMSDKNTRACET